MSSKKIKVLISNTFNPWFNLATEDYIFRDMNPDTAVLFLWRNSDTVVVGRYQNPWIECNLEKMEADKVFLARRQSGGGAVFQDLGNTNFTLLNGKGDFSKENNNKIICDALATFGIDAYASGRNDLVVDVDGEPRKISGSAYKENIDRSFHHGTMLLNVDLTKLSNYLNPSKKKLEAKGVKSVRSRVANLSELAPEINHEKFCDAVIQSFFKFYGTEVEVEHLDEDNLASIPELKSYYESLASREWRFGNAPKFNHTIEERLSFGTLELMFTTEKGSITNIDVNTDALYPPLIEAWTESLAGKEYSRVGVEAALEEVLTKLPDFAGESRELCQWIVKEIV